LSSPTKRPSGDTLAANLKARREAARLSLAQVAAAVGVTKGAVHGWEKGAQPEQETLERLAELYETTVRELRFGPDPIAVREPPPVSYGLPQPLRVWIHEFLTDLVRANVSDREVEVARTSLTNPEFFRFFVGGEPADADEEQAMKALVGYGEAIKDTLRSRGYPISK
jgi:transcriptional regulator with XRE-family HTH domain